MSSSLFLGFLFSKLLSSQCYFLHASSNTIRIQSTPSSPLCASRRSLAGNSDSSMNCRSQTLTPSYLRSPCWPWPQEGRSGWAGWDLKCYYAKACDRHPSRVFIYKLPMTRHRYLSDATSSQLFVTDPSRVALSVSSHLGPPTNTIRIQSTPSSPLCASRRLLAGNLDSSMNCRSQTLTLSNSAFSMLALASGGTPH